MLFVWNDLISRINARMWRKSFLGFLFLFLLESKHQELYHLHSNYYSLFQLTKNACVMLFVRQFLAHSQTNSEECFKCVVNLNLKPVILSRFKWPKFERISTLIDVKTYKLVPFSSVNICFWFLEYEFSCESELLTKSHWQAVE